MFNETTNDLAQACTELAREDKKFPTIWATKLKCHALVEGIPRQRFVGARSLLDIPLVTATSSCSMRTPRNSMRSRPRLARVHPVALKYRKIVGAIIASGICWSHGAALQRLRISPNDISYGPLLLHRRSL